MQENFYFLVVFEGNQSLVVVDDVFGLRKNVRVKNEQ